MKKYVVLLMIALISFLFTAYAGAGAPDPGVYDLKNEVHPPSANSCDFPEVAMTDKQMTVSAVDSSGEFSITHSAVDPNGILRVSPNPLVCTDGNGNSYTCIAEAQVHDYTDYGIDATITTGEMVVLGTAPTNALILTAPFGLVVDCDGDACVGFFGNATLPCGDHTPSQQHYTR